MPIAAAPQIKRAVNQFRVASAEQLLEICVQRSLRLVSCLAPVVKVACGQAFGHAVEALKRFRSPRAKLLARSELYFVTKACNLR